MKGPGSPAALSDEHLLEELSSLVKRESRITATVVAHIAEVDRRKLYLAQACPSMHAFCIERLHLSEGAAARRIRVSRAARAFPILLDLLASGEIHLAGAHLLAPHLTRENHREVLARARHRSKRDIEKLVAELAPKPDVPSTIRRQPASPNVRAARPSPAAAPAGGAPNAEGQSTSDARAVDDRAAPEKASRVPDNFAAPPARPARLAPLSGHSYALTVTLDDESYAHLEELRDLLAHQVPTGDPAAIVKRALAHLRDQALAKKSAATDRPRKTAPSETRTRHIPAWIRRAVWRRDGGRCTFADAHGRRCGSRRALEYHHLENWAEGGEHGLETLALRCRAHNQYQAELDYGAAFMEAKRRDRGGARDPRAPYGRASDIPGWSAEACRSRGTHRISGEGAGALSRTCERARSGGVPSAAPDPDCGRSAPPRRPRPKRGMLSRSRAPPPAARGHSVRSGGTNGP